MLVLVTQSLLLLLAIVGKVRADTEAAVCGHPGLPAGGRFVSPDLKSSPGPGLSSFLSFKAGDVVKYGCKAGKVLSGSEERVCQENGTWSHVIPTCRENLALKKTSLQSGGNDGDQTSFAPTLAVDGDLNTCTYTPVSTEQRWWQVQIPRTVIESVAVSITPSSHQQFTIFVIELTTGGKALYKPCATFKGNFDEALAVFLCNGGKGYKGEFVYIRDDRENGPGVEYFSLCEVRVFGLPDEEHCGTPEQSVGSVMTMERSVSTVASVQCQQGWVMVGQEATIHGQEPAPVLLHCDKGQWIGAPPRCKEIECPDPISPKSGYIEVSNFKGRYQYGSVATYRCNPGYILWGNDTRLCSSNGSWSGTAPSCNPISCGTPPTLDTNTIMEMVNGSTTWQSVVSYTCLPGYKDKENKTVVFSTCLTEGIWSPVKMDCKYDPNFLSGTMGSWNITETLRVNMMTVIIIAVCGVMFIISIIVALIVISHRVMSSSSSPHNDHPSKHSPASHHHLLYDQVGMVPEDDDYNNLYDSNSMIEDPYGDFQGKVGVIVYDDLKNPHLVETDPSSLMAVRSPALTERRSPQSEERSSGDGGSDKGGHYDKVQTLPLHLTPSHGQYSSFTGGQVSSPQYATVGRRVRQDTDIYSPLRRHQADGESDECDNDRVYETVSKSSDQADRSLSSENSSLSQATVRLAKDDNISLNSNTLRNGSNNSSTINLTTNPSFSTTTTTFSNINISSNNLYARVDMKMKKKSVNQVVSPEPDARGGHKDI